MLRPRLGDVASRTLEITFIGNAKPVQDAFDKVGESGGKLTAKMGGLQSSMGGVATVAGGFLAGQAITSGISAFKSLGDQGASLALQQQKVNTVFGEARPIVDEWAKANANGMGLTRSQASNLAAGLADLLIPMGMTREAAAAMATKTIGLSGALAEWSGGTKSAAEVSDILTKAYLGETDGLKALGISISAEDVKMRLAAEGNGELTGAARQQAEALAIQAMVFEKSTDAQTAFADGAGSAARKQAEMSARADEMKERLANGLQPVFIAISSLLVEKVVPALESLSTWLIANKPVLVAAAAAISVVMVAAFTAWAVSATAAAVATIAAAAPVIAVVAVVALLAAGIFLLIKHWDDLTAKYPKLAEASEAVKEKWQQLVAWITGTFVPGVMVVYTAVSEAVTKAVKFVIDHWDEIRAFIEPAMKAYAVIAEAAFKQIQNVIQTVLGVIKGVVDVFMGVFTGDWDRAWDGVKQIVESVWKGFETTIRNDIGLIKGLAPLIKEAGMALGGALLDGLKSALSATAGFAGDVAGAVLSMIKNLVNSQVIDRINSALEISFDTHVPGVGTIHINPPDIPHLAAGGIVTRPTLALIGESGPEAVIPLSRAGGVAGGVTLNFSGPVYMRSQDEANRTLTTAARAAGLI